MVLTLLRLHDARGERKALMATGHLCLKRGTQMDSRVLSIHNIGNYAANIYMSICSTLKSIKMLLKEGHIMDAFVLIRKLFDTMLVEIYLNVVREDKFDWMESLVVKDVDEWLRTQHWIPRTDKILEVLKESKTTKDLYPWFGWDTYLKTNRSHLDNHVHASSYYSILLNCPELYLKDREKQLKNASVILKQIMRLLMRIGR